MRRLPPIALPLACSFLFASPFSGAIRAKLRPVRAWDVRLSADAALLSAGMFAIPVQGSAAKQRCGTSDNSGRTKCLGHRGILLHHPVQCSSLDRSCSSAVSGGALFDVVSHSVGSAVTEYKELYSVIPRKI